MHRIQPVHAQGYILISSTGCSYFLIDGRVEGQYATFLALLNKSFVGVRSMHSVRTFFIVYAVWHAENIGCTSLIKYECVNGARGVMVIVVGNGHGDTSSNPGRDWLHST